MARYGREDYDQRTPFADFPEDMPTLVIAGWDRAAPGAMRDYARRAREIGASETLVASAMRLADETEVWQAASGERLQNPRPERLKAMKYRHDGIEYEDFAALKPILAAEVGVAPDHPHGVHGRTFQQDHPVPGCGYILFMPGGGWTPGGSPHQFEYATEEETGVRIVTRVEPTAEE